MKNFLALLLFIPSLVIGQLMTCCKPTTTEQFGLLASSVEFASAHLAPLPLDFIAFKGELVTFECSDGARGNAFEIRAEKETDNWLFVFHEWWGLNDYVKREAERFSNEIPNVNIFAIDLYDGKVAETPEEAQETMKEMKDERARILINGAIKFAGKKSKISTIGWCFGGGWSLQSSIMCGKQGVACVMYYGMPEEDLKKLKKLNSEVLGIFATKDKWITPAVVGTFKKNMATADKRITLKSYKADHAFANPSNPNYDTTFAENAHKVALSFLKTRMK